MSPGPRSRIQRAPASCRAVTSSTQSTCWTRMASVMARASSTSSPTASAQRPTMSMPSASRGVEPTSTATGSNTGLKHRTAAHLALALGGLGLGDLLAVQLEAGQLFRACR